MLALPVQPQGGGCGVFRRDAGLTGPPVDGDTQLLGALLRIRRRRNRLQAHRAVAVAPIEGDITGLDSAEGACRDPGHAGHRGGGDIHEHRKPGVAIGDAAFRRDLQQALARIARISVTVRHRVGERPGIGLIAREQIFTIAVPGIGQGQELAQQVPHLLGDHRGIRLIQHFVVALNRQFIGPLQQVADPGQDRLFPFQPGLGAVAVSLVLLIAFDGATEIENPGRAGRIVRGRLDAAASGQLQLGAAHLALLLEHGREGALGDHAGRDT